MARNRFAQPLYGKIIYIYETDLDKDQLSMIFDPKTYWIDVSGIECEVGYVLQYIDGEGLKFVPPPNEKPITFEEAKTKKVEIFKVERDRRESDIIKYKDIILDYDDKARERMRIARDFLVDNEVSYITWTCADNSHAILTVEDFISINTLAAQRSNSLHEQYNKLKDFIDTIESEEELEKLTFDTEIIDPEDYIIEETNKEENIIEEDTVNESGIN